MTAPRETTNGMTATTETTQPTTRQRLLERLGRARGILEPAETRDADAVLAARPPRPPRNRALLRPLERHAHQRPHHRHRDGAGHHHPT